jgi:hypothetical protein
MLDILLSNLARMLLMQLQAGGRVLYSWCSHH